MLQAFQNLRRRLGNAVLNANKKIGETRNLKDAIELIKASVDGDARNVKILDW